MAILRDTTINGGLVADNLTLKGGVQAGTNAYLWTDSEGGNLRLKSPNDITWKMDTYNDDFRLIYYNSDLTDSATPFSVDYSEKQVYFYSTPYGKNKVLWSGAFVMSEVHTVTLIEPISKQPHGAVLVWVAYNNGVAYCDFSYSFIPKWHVNAVPGCGITTFMASSDWEARSTKYVYVNDTTIIGYYNNEDGKTANVGFGQTPNYWVLHQVIGI